MNQDLITTADGTAEIVAFRAKEICSPKFKGCEACVGGEVRDGVLFAIIKLKSPIGDFTFERKIGSGFSEVFTFKNLIEFHLTVSDVKETGAGFSFLVSAKLCVNVPFFGKKCTKEFSGTVNVPFGNTISGPDVESLQQLPYMLYAAHLEEEDCGCR